MPDLPLNTVVYFSKAEKLPDNHKIIRIRTLTLRHDYHLILRPHSRSTICSKKVLCGKGSRLASPAMCNCPVSCVSFCLGHSSVFLWLSWPGHFWRDRHVILQNVPQFRFFWHSPMIRFRACVFGRSKTGVMLCPSHPVLPGGMWLLFVPLPAMSLWPCDWGGFCQASLLWNYSFPQ